MRVAGGQPGPGGLIELHGCRCWRSTPQAILLVGRTLPNVPPACTTMPTAAEIFLAVQHLYTCMPDQRGLFLGIVSAISSVLEKRTSAGATGAPLAADMGGNFPVPPEATFAIGVDLDFARVGLIKPRVYLDTISMVFGNCFSRTVSPIVEDVCALLARTPVRSWLSVFAHLGDRVTTLTSAFDACYLPASTQWTNPTQLYGQFSSLGTRLNVGVNADYTLEYVYEAPISVRTFLLCSTLLKVRSLERALLITADASEMDFPENARAGALCQQDTLLPCQNSCEKAGFNMVEHLTMAHQHQSMDSTIAFSRSLVWSSVVPIILGRAWTAYRDMQGINLQPKDSDESASTRKQLRDFGAVYAATLRFIAGNAALPPGQTIRIFRLQMSFYDRANIMQQGLINIPLDDQGYLQLETVPMVSRMSAYNEFRVPTIGALPSTLVNQLSPRSKWNP